MKRCKQGACCPQCWLPPRRGQRCTRGRHGAGGRGDRGIRSREENGVWLMHPQRKNGQGLSFVSLFVTLQCGFDYSTWTQQISSLRTVENIDVLFTKNFWEACCTYVSTTTCLDGFYLIAFWKAYGENFYCGAFNFEMCCAWRNKLLGVTVLLYLCKVCWCMDVYLGSPFIVISGARVWIVPCWRFRFVCRRGLVEVRFARNFCSQLWVL